MKTIEVIRDNVTVIACIPSGNEIVIVIDREDLVALQEAPALPSPTGGIDLPDPPTPRRRRRRKQMKFSGDQVTARHCPICRDLVNGTIQDIVKHQLIKGCTSAHKCTICGLATKTESGKKSHESRIHPKKEEALGEAAIEL